jgi:uncharacterized membrane protein YheB (UPF0754 family)
MEWLFLNYSNLNESVSKQQKDKNKKQQKVLEDKEVPNQDKLENDLESATNSELKEKDDFFNQINKSQTRLKLKQGNSFFDGSAGFVTSGLLTEKQSKRNYKK